ncbi:MAG: adenylate/guanylate cyclase domain-containing protein [Bacteroidota bacterium]
MLTENYTYKVDYYKRIFIFLVLVVFQSQLFSQTIDNNIDSLLTEAEKETVTANKINLLTEAFELSHNNSIYEKEEQSLLKLIETFRDLKLREQTYGYLLKLKYLYNNKPDYEKLAGINYETGVILFTLELYSNARIYFLELEQLFHNFDNISIKQKSLKYLGDISSINNRHEEALIWYKKSLQQAKKEFNTEQIYRLYQLIGLEYQKSDMIYEGIEYYSDILGQLPLYASKSIRGILHNNLGVLYTKTGDLELSEINLERALDLIPQEEEYADILARTNINLAVILQKTNRQSDALNRTRQATFLSNLSKNEILKNEINYLTSNIYFYVADYHNALLYIDETIESSRINNTTELTSKALLFKSKIYGAMGSYEQERDFKSNYLEEENNITNENKAHEAKLNSKRINIERIEKDALVFQKKSAEEIADKERIKADLEAQKARESRILRDQAIAIAQHEVDKNRIIEIEKDAALNKAKQDSLTAVNALVQEEIAKQKSKSDSINTALAIQKQRIAQKEVDAANEILKRSYLIAILLGAILIIIIVGMLYQRRLNSQIKKERDKSDKLLLNILPKRIANELKHNTKVAPRKYESVSVLFTDFTGFTNIAEELSEDELIKELDRYFNEFDNIIEKHNLEKIKTIGDSYMCAGGVPSPNNSNAMDAINAGLEIAEFVTKDIEEKKKFNIPYWNIRIGINTGQVIAGVVGSKKFAYDIWGDTVNTASRIESNGLEGFVNISQSTYDLVKDNFNCISRGMIIAKNKGPVPMYYVKNKIET